MVSGMILPEKGITMANKKSIKEHLAGAVGLLITLAAAFIIVLILVFLLSKDPLRTISYFFSGPFRNKFYFGNMINASIPLIFTGLGISLAFKSSMFNLGGEGQVYSGGLAATAVCLALPLANPFLGSIFALIAAFAAGGIIAGLSGVFKMAWDTDELITSFLISSALILIVDFIITGPMDDPTNNLLATSPIPLQYRFLKIYPPSKLDISLFFALFFAAGVYFFMNRTHWGYEMRMCGLNREFARYGGINVGKFMVIPMILSGGLHGLGGGFAILGTYDMCLKGFSGGMGWNGIAVALIAKNNPLAVIPAALFFAYLEAGAKAAMLHSDVTFEIAAIVQSVIFYLVTAQALYGLVSSKKRKAL